jgi:hypothetical protein
VQNSIVILGLGATGSLFATSFTCANVVHRHIFCHEGINKDLIRDCSDQNFSNKLIAEFTQDIYDSIKDHELVILAGALGEDTGSALMPGIANKLIKEDKICFALATIPLRSKENEEYQWALEIVKQLKKIMPEKHSSILDLEEFGKNIQGETEGLYKSIVISFFESETEYILNHGALYRIFNLPLDADPIEITNSMKTEKLSVEELLESLNGFWKNRVKQNIHFDEDRVKSESIALEIKKRGYSFIVEEQFANSLLPNLVQDEERDYMLAKIRAVKAKVIQEKRYEEAARLRDMEKRMIGKIMSHYFPKLDNDYFLLLNDTIIVYRFSNINIMDDFVRKVADIILK